MFGYTVFLKIGNLAASSLVDMYKDSYQLIGCEFGFAQGMEISYIRQGKSYIATKLTVQAQKLAFGTEEFENQWVF